MNQSRSSVLGRLHRAMNDHNLDAFLACFDEDYDSEQPVHPDRAFRGREQVRQNWSSVFQEMPDFHADLLRASFEGDTIWSEWHWTGTQVDGSPFDWRGVTLFGVKNDKLAWARLYMEPLDSGGAGIDAAVDSMTGQHRGE